MNKEPDILAYFDKDGEMEKAEIGVFWSEMASLLPKTIERAALGDEKICNAFRGVYPKIKSYSFSRLKEAQKEAKKEVLEEVRNELPEEKNEFEAVDPTSSFSNQRFLPSPAGYNQALRETKEVIDKISKRI